MKVQQWKRGVVVVALVLCATGRVERIRADPGDRTVTECHNEWSGIARYDVSLGVPPPCYPSNPGVGDLCRTGPVHSCDDAFIDPNLGGMEFNWNPSHPCYSVLHCPCADCRKYERRCSTVTYDPATVQGTVICSWGEDGWCVSPATLLIVGSEPMPTENITSIDGDRGGEPFSHPGSSSSFGDIGDTAGTTFTYWAVSSWGDTSHAASSPIRVDTAPPVSAPDLPEWISGAATVDGTASDATSGVALVEFSTDGGFSWQGASGTMVWSGGSWDTTSVTDGVYQVCSRARDVAGNQGSPGCLAVHADNTPPMTSAALDGVEGSGGWYLSEVQVGLSASDAGVGVVGVEVQVDGGGWQLYVAPFVVSGDGAHLVEYRSVDSLGNQEAVGSLEMRLDTTPPTGSVTGGSFCAACGDRLRIRLSASDAAPSAGSGVEAWRLEVVGSVVRTWSGDGLPPEKVCWDGRNAAGKLVSPGAYGLRLWIQDAAGWTTEVTDQVRVAAPPTPTPVPTATPTATSTPSPPPPPTQAPVPTDTPSPAPTSFPTPTPVPVAVVEPRPRIALRALLFRDYDADGRRDDDELGLAGLLLEGHGPGGWSGAFTADASGLLSIVVPGPGTYVFCLADKPDGEWQATTQTLLRVQIGEDGSAAVLSPASGAQAPVGVAEGMLFAIGMRLRRVAIWLPLVGAGLGLLVALAAALDRRAAAIRDLEGALGQLFVVLER